MYVSAFLDGDDVVVIERVDGERVIRNEPVDWSFFIKDQYGDHKSIFDEPLSRVVPQTRQEFYMKKKQFKPENLYESDVNRVHKYLSENYGEDDVPVMRVGFFDIEVAYTPENKYSNADDAENTIISVSITDKDTRITTILALPPSTLTYDEAGEIMKKVTEHSEIFHTEKEMIDRFLDLIQDFDVISGWNSDRYDVKYIINRIKNVMPDIWIPRLCLCGKDPKPKSVENKKYKTIENYYELVGRVHVDYLDLYKKYTYNEVPGGYSLDNISYMELDDRKVPYSGTLDQLYKQDFEKFIRYNIQDTELIMRLDDKLKFIETTNIRAHQNGVILQAALGTVGIVEQAIINEGHRYYSRYFNDKTALDGDVSGAAGAFVVDPKAGIRRYVAGNDINSLYPSVIRALNMSPETIIGQVLTTRTDEKILELMRVNNWKPSEAWRQFFSTLEFDDVINKRDTIVSFELNATKDIIETPAYKIYDMIYNSDDYVISANGTVFTRKKYGIIPHLLERWYTDRMTMQAKADEWEAKMMSLDPESDDYKDAKYWYGYWYQRQLAKKIDLNSLYGALLNKHCRFYDKRLGQSTTLTGRSITRHMAAKINEIITGEYDYLGKSIVYGDSVSSDTIIQTTMGDMSVEDAFNLGNCYWSEPNTDKEYSHRTDMKVKTFDPDTDKEYFGDINYIYRHKTSKSKWQINDHLGNSVEVTGDHSIMVERDHVLIQVKPKDMTTNDILISFNNDHHVRGDVKSIVQLDDYDDEYVYDVGMTYGDNNWFFGNNILVKNTDSVQENTIVDVNGVKKEIGKLFHENIKSDGDLFHINESEYVFPHGLTSKTYNDKTRDNETMDIDYIYRHKVEKMMYEIEDEDGNIVTVTEDHSIMVERNDILVEVKPTELLDDDILITV